MSKGWFAFKLIVTISTDVVSCCKIAIDYKDPNMIGNYLKEGFESLGNILKTTK